MRSSNSVAGRAAEPPGVMSVGREYKSGITGCLIITANNPRWYSPRAALNLTMSHDGIERGCSASAPLDNRPEHQVPKIQDIGS
jgi:hypothetical protein